MNVKVYSTPTCPHCVAVKAFLEEKKVAFEQVDVSENAEALKEMVEKSGQQGVPVVDIDGEIIVGFDEAKLSEKLK